MRQTCATTSTSSVGTQTADAMVSRFLSEQDAQRLESDDSLPTPELGPHGEVLAPTRHDLSVDPSTLGRTRPVGVPASNDHLLRHIHPQDGYGGLEASVQVEELDHVDLMDLQEFFAKNGPPVADLVLRSRAEATSGDELESALRSIPVQRERAALLSGYRADNLAERTFSTAFLLRRILDRYRRVCHLLNASASGSRQDALKSSRSTLAAQAFA
ncbi:hypothetical protein PR003_g11414 [Phytophthora rubi]|uniref:Uncharacterized protein n=1 Tax=Phytophthora rubi TaxID=129364 RepID=A0A6A4FNE2_9STRA|nr:hypothetical protein PR001_g3272 [Phytophthora rubi]KAE9338634.1 hypothetical protein PR003_g11414 [Phytophthora rubi]